MIQKIEVFAADVDMTLSSKGSPLPEITIQALKELHDKNVKIGIDENAHTKMFCIK